MNSIQPQSIVLYTPRQIAYGSFIGSPLAGFWFISRNLLHLGEKQKSTQTLIWGFFGSIALLIATLFLPERFPTFGVPIAYTLMMYFLATRLFAHSPSGSNFDVYTASFMKVIAISLIWLVVVCIIGFILIEFTPDGYFPGE